MKLSKLIEELQKIEKKYGGELPCCVYDPEKAAEGDYTSCPVHVGLGFDETGNTPTEITLMDYETALAFS